MKLTNFHIVISSLAAIAGVGIAAYQTFLPNQTAQAPLNVVVSLDQPKADSVVPNETVTKSDVPALKTETINLAEGASFAPALKDGSENRYSFGTLFDGQPDTFLAITPPDQELNMLVNFPNSQVRSVTAIEYTPPEGVDPAAMAETVDVTVMPGGDFSSGLQVYSFSLPQSSEPRVFAIPGGVQGVGINLRVAAKPGVPKSYVGDFKILSEQVAP